MRNLTTPPCLLIGLLIASTPSSIHALPTPIAQWSFNDPLNVGLDSAGIDNHLAFPGPWSSVASAPGTTLGTALQLAPFGGAHPAAPNTAIGGELTYPGPGGFAVSFWTTVETGKAGVIRDYWEHVASGEVMRIGSNGNDTFSFGIRTGFGGMPQVEVDASAFLGSWVNLVGVYDPSGYLAKLYVNGQFAGQTAIGGPMRSSLPPRLYVGGSWHGTDGFDAAGPALLDEVVIYNTALSDSQVLELYSSYQAGNGVPDQPHWHLLPIGLLVLMGYAYCGSRGQLRNA